ncbi:MAG: SHOCT domain-containing protein [Mycetocola sp.]
MSLWSNFWEVIVWFFWVYVFIAYLFTLVLVLGDIFRDRTLNGWLKAVWIIFLVFFPLLTTLVYVIARGKGMSERNSRGFATVSEPDDYRPRIIPPASPSDEIAKAQELLAAGSITQDEFEALKAKALA